VCASSIDVLTVLRHPDNHIDIDKIIVNNIERVRPADKGTTNIGKSALNV